jgi:hypothetical protein
MGIGAYELSIEDCSAKMPTRIGVVGDSNEQLSRPSTESVERSSDEYPCHL